MEVFLIIIWNLQVPANGFHSTVFGWYPGRDCHLYLAVAFHQLGHTPAGNGKGQSCPGSDFMAALNLPLEASLCALEIDTS